MTNSLLSALDDIPMRFLEVEALTRVLEDVVAPWLPGVQRSHQTEVGWSLGGWPPDASSQQRQGDDV